MRSIRDRKIFGIPASLFLLLTISSLLLLWCLWSYHLNGNLAYAYFFFEEIYIIISVTLFGFLLVASSSLIHTASATKIYLAPQMYSHDIDENEGYEDRRRNITDNAPGICLSLLLLFIFSIASWIGTLFAIQKESIGEFYIYAFLCIALMIFSVGLTVYQIYIAARIREKSTESEQNKPPTRSSMF